MADLRCVGVAVCPCWNSLWDLKVRGWWHESCCNWFCCCAWCRYWPWTATSWRVIWSLPGWGPTWGLCRIVAGHLQVGPVHPVQSSWSVINRMHIWFEFVAWIEIDPPLYNVISPSAVYFKPLIYRSPGEAEMETLTRSNRKRRVKTTVVAMFMWSCDQHKIAESSCFHNGLVCIWCEMRLCDFWSKYEYDQR